MQGVVYIAVGDLVHLEAALISAVVFTRLNPGISATIFCDRDQVSLSTFNEKLFSLGIRVRAVEAPPVRSGRFAAQALKIQLGSLTPYSETLYLDADVLPLKPVGQIWEYLSLGCVAMVLDCHPTVGECDHIAQIEIDYTLSRVLRTTPQFNSGVMLWRSDDVTRSLFSRWKAEWGLFGRHDQLALVRATKDLGISIREMPLKYNTPPQENEPVSWPGIDAVDLLHCWGGWVRSGSFADLARQKFPDIAEGLPSLLSLIP